MTRSCRLVRRLGKVCVLSGVALLAATVALAASAGDEARALLQKAEARKADPAFLHTCLAEADALAARADADSLVHYTRGWLLSHLERSDDAMAAYRRATELPPVLAEAHYNLGVLFSAAKRREEALKEYEETIRLSPNDSDALYNAGQTNYDLERYGAALSRWRAAQKLQPHNYQVARKVLQALNALGLAEEAALARDDVLRIHREKLDPAVAELKLYCFDQIPLPNNRVFAYEAFAPLDGGIVWRFQITDITQKTTLHTIALRHREGSKHVLQTLAPSDLKPIEFSDRPTWRTLKPVIRDWAAQLVASPPKT